MQVPPKESIEALDDIIPENYFNFHPYLHIKQLFVASSVHLRQPVKAVLQTSGSVDTVTDVERVNPARMANKMERKFVNDFICFIVLRF